MRNVTAKKSALIAGVWLALGLFLVPGVQAEESNCVSVYGGGVVCGEETPEVPVVEAGLTDIDFLAVAQVLGAAAGGLFFLSRLTRRVYLLDR